MQLRAARDVVPARIHERRLRDVLPLFAHGLAGREYYVVDLCCVQIVARLDGLEEIRDQVDRLDLVERAPGLPRRAGFPPAPRRADGIVDKGFCRQSGAPIYMSRHMYAL